MIYDAEMTRLQREHDERQMIFQAEQAALADKRHQDNLQIAIAANKSNVWSNVAAGVIGAVATLLAVIVGWLLTKP